VRWSRSPVTSSGEFSDTALFPWRTGADAMGSTLDEPAPAAVTTAATRRWPLSADLGLLCARLVLGAVAILHGTGILSPCPAARVVRSRRRCSPATASSARTS